MVARAAIATGLAHVFVRHTSCSLLLTENADPDVRLDLETLFARLVPDGDPIYRHDLEGQDDMAAGWALPFWRGTELTVPVGNGGTPPGRLARNFPLGAPDIVPSAEIVVTVIG